MFASDTKNVPRLKGLGATQTVVKWAFVERFTLYRMIYYVKFNLH